MSRTYCLAVGFGLLLVNAGGFPLCRAQENVFQSGPWWLLGAFHWVDEGRLFWGDRPLPPDGELDLTAAYPGRQGPVRWRQVPEWSDDGRTYEIAAHTDTADATTCTAVYLYRRVDAATDCPALLYLGFNDGLILRVNGEVVFRRFYYRETAPRQEAIPLQLHAGRNDFLLKLVDKDNTSPCSFVFELKARDAIRSGDRALSNGIGRVESVVWSATGALFTTERGLFRLAFWQDAVLRLTFVPTGAPWPFPVSQRPLPVPADLVDHGTVRSVTEDEERYVLTGSRLTVTLARDGAMLALRHSGQVRRLELTVEDEPQKGRQMVAALHLTPAETVYGTGERYDTINRRGRRNVIHNADRAYGDTHFTLPYLATRGGDALFANTYGGGEIDVDLPGAEDLALFRLQEEVADCFYFTGTPKELVLQWVDLTGHTVMPPDWALGVWMSRNLYENAQVVMDVARTLRQHQVPAHVLVLEGWRGGADGWMDWEPQNWPQPRALCQALHEMGFKVVLWTMQYFPVNPESPTPAQQEAVEQRYFMEWDDRPWGWEPNVFAVDFSQSAACDWWARLHRPLFDSVTGIDALKTDIGENVAGNTVAGWRQVNQRYAFDYLRCNWEMTRALTGHGVVFARTGTVGTQQYPILWAGDHSTWFQGMQEAYHAMMSTGLQGYAWTSFDVGGLYGDLDKETYIRMVQMGAFCPIMQAHGQGPREPFAFDDDTVHVFNQFANWYMALKPYRTAAGQVACETGLPIMRPLWLEYPDDPESWDAEFQYLFGPDIVVAPVFSYDRRRTVYLPPGKWIDWWTGERFEGKQTLDVYVPLERMPLYVRAGSEVLRLAPCAAAP